MSLKNIQFPKFLTETIKINTVNYILTNKLNVFKDPHIVKKLDKYELVLKGKIPRINIFDVFKICAELNLTLDEKDIKILLETYKQFRSKFNLDEEEMLMAEFLTDVNKNIDEIVEIVIDDIEDLEGGVSNSIKGGTTILIANFIGELDNKSTLLLNKIKDEINRIKVLNDYSGEISREEYEKILNMCNKFRNKKKRLDESIVKLNELIDNKSMEKCLEKCLNSHFVFETLDKLLDECNKLSTMIGGINVLDKVSVKEVVNENVNMVKKELGANNDENAFVSIEGNNHSIIFFLIVIIIILIVTVVIANSNSKKKIEKYNKIRNIIKENSKTREDNKKNKGVVINSKNEPRLGVDIFGDIEVIS